MSRNSHPELDTVIETPCAGWLKVPGHDVLGPGVTKCLACDEHGHVGAIDNIPVDCPACGGIAYHGIDVGPCDFAKGSRMRSLVMRARYIAGLPLWNDADTHEFIPNTKNHQDREEPWTVPECHDDFGFNGEDDE